MIDAQGKPLTPALFGGISEIGLEEVSGEDATTDGALALGLTDKDMVVRPEFDVTLAYNPESVLLPVARVEGIGFTLLGALPTAGGSIVGGQGAVMRLDGSLDPFGPKVLFVGLGGDSAANLTGTSRAAQWMLLDQLIDEIRGRIPPASDLALLTPSGRSTLARYIGGGGRVVFEVHRAADIRQLLRWSKRHDVRIAVVGRHRGLESRCRNSLPPRCRCSSIRWRTCRRISTSSARRSRTPRACVRRASRSASRSAIRTPRAKLRQFAGNAVANGLPWEDGLAGLTRVPAEAFGVGDRLGGIAPGKLADLVLWSGDPLEVNTVARQVWLGGKAMPMRSRQTELRDRYLRSDAPREGGGLPRAYPAVVR